MIRKLAFLLSVILIATLGVNCEKEITDAKNMEQLHAEQGVPVRINTIQYTSFNKELHYHAQLTGIEESTAYAPIADNVKQVFVKVGDYVAQNDILLAFPTDNPSANYYQAKVAFENAKTAFKRMESLYQSGGISQQDLDNAHANFKVAQANWNAAQQTIHVRAPISGYVTKVNVRETDNVYPGSELFTISRLDKIKATLWVAEKDIASIKPGLPAIAIWNDIQVPGKLVQVDLAMNPRMNAFGAFIEFENPDNRLKGGTTAEIRITTYANDSSIVVARKDVLFESGQSYVYLARNNVAERRPVVIGHQQSMDLEIIQGLNPGDSLIVAGQSLLQPGKKIKIVQVSGDR